jgi:aspartyl protease family protein
LKNAAWLLAALLPLTAAAQDVALGGRMGTKAMLVIDGRSQVLGVGESARGVTLVAIDGEGVMVESGGRRYPLKSGAAPLRLAGTPAAGGGAREVVIPAGPGGHFVVGGSINGRSVQFLVDTGATLVSMSQAEAQRLGVDFKGGERVLMQTANGTAPVHVVTLATLRVGDVELAHVQAAVIPAPMPGILLGNSVLSRFSMRRDSDIMRLTVR